jgi:hypothetical protein
MNSHTVKALALQYWRYDKGCPVVALEYCGDVCCITPNRFLIETEVKISISDLRRDIKKPSHCYIRRRLGLAVDEKVWGHAATLYRGHREEKTKLAKISWERQFYFAVPYQITEKAVAVIDELYPYAGLLEAFTYDDYTAIRWGGVRVVRNAKPLPAQRLPIEQVIALVKAQSATLTRLALKVGKP